MKNILELELEQNPPKQEHQFVQYSYRYLILVIFFLQSFVNGVTWVVVTPVALPIAHAYHQSASLVSLIPMSFVVVYPFINFPSNWVLDGKGIRPGIIIGIALTAIGAGIRVLIPFDFTFLIIGQFLCAIGQPFILNATTKISVRWFLPQSRSVALAILTTSNIIGNAVGVILPPLFVHNGDSSSTIQAQFTVLLAFEFLLTLVPLIMTIFWFEEHPPTPASPAPDIQHHRYIDQFKYLFTDRHFLTLNFAFGCIYGLFAVYGSISDNILSYYGYSSREVSYFVASQYMCGMVAATSIGYYIQHSLNYSLAFKSLTLLALADAVGVPMVLMTLGKSVPWMLVLFGVMGIIFISLIPLSFGYGCDVLYPAGQAQITGCFLSTANIIAIILIVISQNVFGLARTNNNHYQNKMAGLNTVIMLGIVMIVAMLFFFFFNAELKRSILEKRGDITYHDAYQQTKQ